MASRADEIRKQIADLDKQINDLVPKQIYDPLPEIDTKNTQQVKALQSKLKSLGLYAKPVDGVWEAGTQKAVQDYNGLRQGLETRINTLKEKAAPLLTEKTRLSGELSKVLKTEAETDPYEQVRQVGINAVPPAIGYGAGIYKGYTQEGKQALQDAANKASAKGLAEAYNKINSNSPTAQTQLKALGEEAKASGFLRNGRPLKTYVPGLGLVALGLSTRFGAAPYVRDQNEIGGEVLGGLGGTEIGTGAGMLTMQMLNNAVSKPVVDAADRQKFRTAIALGERASPVAPTPDAVKDALKAAELSEPVEPHKGQAVPVLKKEVKDNLGLKLGANKKANIDIIQNWVDKIPPDSPSEAQKLFDAAERFGIKGANKLGVEGAKKALGNLLSHVKNNPTTFGGLAAIIAASLLDAGPAKADYGYKPGEPSLIPTPPSLAERVNETVPHLIPSVAAWDIGSAAGDMGRSLLDKRSSVIPPPPPKEYARDPSTGDPSNYELPSFVNPRSPSYNPSRIRDEQASRRNLEQIQSQQERDRRPPRELIGSEAANAKPIGVDAGDQLRRETWAPYAKPSALEALDEGTRSALPEHERGLLEAGADPLKAVIYNHARHKAGLAAMERGEPYEGGTEQYEKQRRALQTFYNAAAIDAAAATSSAAPGSDERAAGGQVTRPLSLQLGWSD